MDLDAVYIFSMLICAFVTFVAVFSPAFSTFCGVGALLCYQLLTRAQDVTPQGERFAILRLCGKRYKRVIDRALLNKFFAVQVVLLVICLLGTSVYVYIFGIFALPSWAQHVTQVEVKSCRFVPPIRINDKYTLRGAQDCFEAGDFVYFCVQDTEFVEKQPCALASGTNVQGTMIVLSSGLMLVNVALLVTGAVYGVRTLRHPVSSSGDV